MNSLKKLFSFKGLFALLVIAISFQIISPNVAFAKSETLQGLAELLAVFISVLTFISLLMMNLFGQLLGTDLLTGPAAMQALTPMWVWVRNLTNILFVLVLVGLAFSNLYSSFGSEGGGNWTIKEKLPKVIIALVAINFSLLGFRLVIDAVNVGTVAILGIADSRLDADNPEQKSSMENDKTWTIISDTAYEAVGEKVEPKGIDDIRGGDSCTTDHLALADEDKDKTLGFKKTVKGTTKYYICRDFRSQVNDLFCPGWAKNREIKESKTESSYPSQETLDDDCLFILKKDSFHTMLSPSDEPGQNLFMSFGTVFMHLERLPALGAQIDSLDGVIMNTLFSSILAITYIVALVAVFIALLARVVVIWIALVFSPLLIAASIMGFGEGKAGEAVDMLVTHLIMPLKIAAAFAVSFVMMSGMIEFNTVGQNDSFLFGPALSHLGIAEYGFMWQIATIVIFWKAAQWATEGSLASGITEQIFTGAQALGTAAARAATIDRQIFTVGTGTNKPNVTLSNLFAAPALAQEYNTAQKNEGMKALRNKYLGESEFRKSLEGKTFNSTGQAGGKEMLNAASSAKSIEDFNTEFASYKDAVFTGTGAAAKAFKDYLSKNPNKSGHEALKGFSNETGTTYFTQDLKRKIQSGDIFTGTGETKKTPTGTGDGSKAATTNNSTPIYDDKTKKLSGISVTTNGNVIPLSNTDLSGDIDIATLGNSKTTALGNANLGKAEIDALMDMKSAGGENDFKAVIDKFGDKVTNSIHGFKNAVATAQSSDKSVLLAGKDGLQGVQMYDSKGRIIPKGSNGGETITYQNIKATFKAAKENAAKDGAKQEDKDYLAKLDEFKKEILSEVNKGKGGKEIAITEADL